MFASNDFGTHIDRIGPGGTCNAVGRGPTADGLAVDPRPVPVRGTDIRGGGDQRVQIANPANVTTHARPGLLALAAGLDGLAIDPTGRLYVAANGAGQFWRVEPDGTITALARGLKFPSAVAIGHGPGGFREGNLYAVTFHGDIVGPPARYASPAPGSGRLLERAPAVCPRQGPGVFSGAGTVHRDHALYGSAAWLSSRSCRS